MANNKRKDLGIGSFIDSVKADQPATPRKAATASNATSAVDGSPIDTPRRTASAPAPSKAQQAQPSAPDPDRTPGRPGRTQSLLSKKLAKLVYIDTETELQLKLIKTFQNYDYKEVIFTAIHEFLDQHYRDMRLDAKGVDMVEAIIRDYKTRS